MKIKPEIKVGRKQITMTLPEDLVAQLEVYRGELGGDTTLNYLVTEITRTFLESDKEFQKRLSTRAAGSTDKKAVAAVGTAVGARPHVSA